jgi:MFS transporter, DHA1 family, multidrug resistance protein
VKILSPAALIALLAVIGLLNSICSDMVIPALPSLRDDLQVSNWQAQQTISLFFGACAFMSLWYGALADAWGRRTVTLGALLVVALTALGCLAASRIEQLWVLRTLQGMASGAGLVISRAVVRDLHIGPTAQKLLSRIMMVQTLSLVATPVIGGWLAATWGWRSVFALIAAIMLALAMACWRWLPETLPTAQRRPLRPAALWHAYAGVARNGSFLRLSTAHVANWVAMAMYAFSAPAIVIHHLGRAATDVWMVFVPITAGLVSGFVHFPRLARHLDGAALLGRAYRILAVAVVLNVALCGLLPAGPLLLAPLFIFSYGMALALPTLIDRALAPVHEHAGVAASCQTFMQFAVMAVGAGILAPLLWDSLFQLALGTGTLTAIGAWCVLHEARHRRAHPCPSA